MEKETEPDSKSSVLRITLYAFTICPLIKGHKVILSLRESWS